LCAEGLGRSWIWLTAKPEGRSVLTSEGRKPERADKPA
jgi:hypothetical protein